MPPDDPPRSEPPVASATRRTPHEHDAPPAAALGAASAPLPDGADAVRDVSTPLDSTEALIYRFLELGPSRTRRQRSADRTALETRIAALRAELRDERLSGAEKIGRAKELHGLRDRLRRLDDAAEYLRARDAFLSGAEAFSRRHGLDYDDWVDLGVPAKLLRAAGIQPTARSRPAHDDRDAARKSANATPAAPD